MPLIRDRGLNDREPILELAYAMGHLGYLGVQFVRPREDEARSLARRESPFDAGLMRFCVGGPAAHREGRCSRILS